MIFISAPGWAQLPWKLSVEVGPPEMLFNKGISDHSPVACTLHFSDGVQNEPPIPTWVAKSSLFNNACRLEDLLPEHALIEYKILIREAARVSRNQLNDKCRHSKKTHLILHLPVV